MIGGKQVRKQVAYGGWRTLKATSEKVRDGLKVQDL